MDLSFSTSAGDGGWSLAECAAWAKTNGFDAIRPNATGVVERVLLYNLAATRSRKFWRVTVYISPP